MLPGTAEQLRCAHTHTSFALFGLRCAFAKRVCLRVVSEICGISPKKSLLVVNDAIEVVCGADADKEVCLCFGDVLWRDFCAQAFMFTSFMTRDDALRSLYAVWRPGEEPPVPVKTKSKQAAAATLRSSSPESLPSSASSRKSEGEKTFAQVLAGERSERAQPHAPLSVHAREYEEECR